MANNPSMTSAIGIVESFQTSSLGGTACSGSSTWSNASTSSNPLKVAKKYRSDNDADKQIVRCKRKLDFIANAMKSMTPLMSVADSVTSTSSGDVTSRVDPPPRTWTRQRPPATVARRNERERKRVSLINQTFETLRDQLPRTMWGHRHIGKVSKVETLRAAIGYIRTLQDLLEAAGEDDDNIHKTAALFDVDDTVDDNNNDSNEPDAVERRRLDAAMSSAERLGALAEIGAPGDEFFVPPTMIFRPPIDDNQLYDDVVERRFHSGLFPVSRTNDGVVLQSIGNSSGDRLQHIIEQQKQRQQQRVVLDATHRLSQLTAGPLDVPQRQYMPSVEAMSKNTVSRLPLKFHGADIEDDSLLLDINSNHRVEWRRLEDDKVDALPSSTTKPDSDFFSSVDSLTERQVHPRIPFGPDDAVVANDVATLNRYLMINHVGTYDVRGPGPRVT